MQEHADSVNGVAYRVVGTGPRTLTCLHSLALSGSWFLPLAEELGDRCTVVLPDLRGHGASPTGDRAITLSELAADVVDVWTHLGIRRSNLLGLSMGGMVAQAIAADYRDRVENLILVATTKWYDDDARVTAGVRAAAAVLPDGIAAMADAVMERWFSAADNPALIACARSQLITADPAAHASLLLAMTEVGSFRLDHEPPPTLVLGGLEDTSTPASVVTALAGAIPGARLEFVPGGHLTTFTHPTATAERVATFLDQ